MTFPKISQKKLKQNREQNLNERLLFVRQYAEWVKKTPNKIWSAQQKKLFD